jgi:hypothetical protein
VGGVGSGGQTRQYWQQGWLARCLHIIFINIAVGWVRGVHLLDVCRVENVIARVLLSSDPLLMSQIFILTMLALWNTSTVLDDIVPPMTALIVTSDRSHELTDLTRRGEREMSSRNKESQDSELTLFQSTPPPRP